MTTCPLTFLWIVSGFFFSPGSEVLIDEKRICVKEAKIAEIKDYRSYIYADIDFSKMDIYAPSFCDKLRPPIIPQSNTCQIIRKTAICKKQIAVFLLTKKLYFRLICRKIYFFYKQLFELDKPGFFTYLGYSSGCRSPPLFWFFY